MSFLLSTKKKPTQTIIDDWNDGDAAEWTGVASVTTTSFEGSHAFEYDVADTTEDTYSNQGDGLDYYPAWGDDIQHYYYLDSFSADFAAHELRWFTYGPYDSSIDSVGYNFDHRDGVVEIREISDGSFTAYSSAALPPIGEWLKIKFFTDSGTGDVTLEIWDSTESTKYVDISSTVNYNENHRGIMWSTSTGNGESGLIRMDMAEKL